MAIFVKGRKEVVAVRAFGKDLTAIYSGDKLVWEAVRSCFGAGFWNNEKPWMNDEAWRNE
mgnify:CR=1 FL=1